MIEKCRMTIALLLARGTFQPFSRECGNILITMLSHEMNNPICPCKSLIRATGALKIGRVLF